MNDAAKKKEDEEPRWKANVKTIGGAIALAMFIRVVLFEAFEIEGPSMMPSLLNGDRVVVAKFMYGLFLPFTREQVLSWSAPSIGSVVIVNSPQDNIDIVKRVVGLPGDTIELRADVVYRNGEPIPTREVSRCDYEAPRDDPGETESADDPGCRIYEEKLEGVTYRISRSDGSFGDVPAIRVPEGHIFVLGDHRDHSNDSRFFGPVLAGRVKGKALAVYWSGGCGQRERVGGVDPSTWPCVGSSFVRWSRIFDPVR